MDTDALREKLMKSIPQGCEGGIRIYSKGISSHTLVTGPNGEYMGPIDRVEIIIDAKTNMVVAKLTMPVAELVIEGAKEVPPCASDS